MDVIFLYNFIIGGENIKKGFTLIELLVVIAIIAILAAVVAPNAFRAIEKSKAATFTSDANTIKKAMVLYYADTGKYPNYSYNGTDKDIFNWIGQAFFVKGDISGKSSAVTMSIPTGWNGPYVERWLQKTPFGGYYTVFDYGASNVGNDTLVTVKKYTDASKNLSTEYGSKKVVTIEIGFGADKAARDKALKILSNYMDKDQIYYQSLTIGGSDYNQVIVPVLIN